MSNNVEINPRGSEHKALLRAEARRILSEFEGRPIGENDIVRDESGRPFFPEKLQFPGRNADFNISHSGNAAAVSYFSGENQSQPLRTGCDIELIRPRKSLRKIAKVFSATEWDYIFSQSSEKLPQDAPVSRFYEIWTLKESFLKLRGLSVFDISGAPSFVNDEGQLSFCAEKSAVSNVPLSFVLYELSVESGEGSSPARYMLAAVVEGTQEEPEIRDFSYLSFIWKKTAQINAAPNPAETVRPKM